MPGDRRQSCSKGRRRHSNSRRRSLVWTSDDTGSDSSIARTAADRNNSKRRHDRPPSQSPSPSSGSSIETRVDRRAKRERNAMRRHPSSGERRLFTHLEDRTVRKSLRQKLLANNATRLGRIERCLLHAANRSDGRASVTAFEDALASDAKAVDTAGRGERVRRNEVLWLIENLKGRNGRYVAVAKIRAVLEEGQRGGGRRGDGDESTQRHLKRRQTRDPFIGRSRSGEVDGSSGSAGSGSVRRIMGGNTSELGVCRMKGARGRPAHPARWATRRGTVGQWLHDVASPMENKLFFEFVKGLETFEQRNGLDHYRVRSEGHSSVRSDEGSGIVDTTCSREDGSTILHLGPMLKAAIRFYV